MILNNLPSHTSSLLRRLRTFVLTAQLVLQFAGTGLSIAGEGPKTEPRPTTKPEPSAPPVQPEESFPADRYLKGKVTAIEQDVEEVHDILEEDILDRVIRLDNFFGKIKTDSKRPTGYQLYWSNFIREEQEGTLRFSSSLRANLVLSRISDRLRLSLWGENKAAPFAPSLPEDPGNPGFDRFFQTTKIVNTELRYGLVQTPSTDIFLGAGIRLVIPPVAFVRSRIQYTYQISGVSLLRFGETLFVNNNSGAGETTEVSLERSIGQKTHIRWANTGTMSHEFREREWGTDLSLIHEFSFRNAMTVAGGIFGSSGPDGVISNYRVLARYRQNFLKSWLFYELEPVVSWPRGGDGTFPARFAITFLVEVAFQGAATGNAEGSGTP
ncbi:MAG TPA: hypothetical protein VN642_16615 [Dongiaceae bacterium]|nr:hypothetical protein [Dongiaceae bacterium]